MHLDGLHADLEDGFWYCCRMAHCGNTEAGRECLHSVDRQQKAVEAFLPASWGNHMVRPIALEKLVVGRTQIEDVQLLFYPRIPLYLDASQALAIEQDLIPWFPYSLQKAAEQAHENTEAMQMEDGNETENGDVEDVQIIPAGRNILKLELLQMEMKNL
jgi:hypothetical protein